MKRCRLFFLLACFLLYRLNTHAQLDCGFDLLHQQKMRSDAAYRQSVAALEARLGSRLPVLSARTATFTDTIPIVVHIVHTGDSIGSKYNPADAQVKATIDYVNQVYGGVWPGVKGAGDIGIRFVLAKRDPACNATTGIDRVDGSVLPGYLQAGVNADGSAGVGSKALMDFVRWDPNRYYNIWVVNAISSVSPGGVGAFAMYPLQAEDDGVFIKAEAMRAGNSTLPHELGHAFFLYHTFEGASITECPLNTDCYTQGDHVCDTDPVTKTGGQGRTGTNPCTNMPYSANTEENFMSYTCCNTTFTEGQKIRMQDAALNTAVRDTLRRSPGRFLPAETIACSFPLYLNGVFTNDHSVLSWGAQPGGEGRYTLERSYDGAVYQSLALINPETAANNYVYHDQAAPQAKNYYRLHQNNSAGSIVYSNTVVLEKPLAQQPGFILVTNPVYSYIDVQIGLLPNSAGNIFQVLHSQARLRLLDLQGRVLYSHRQPITTYERLRIPVADFPHGVYFLQVLVNETIFTKKLVKL